MPEELTALPQDPWPATENLMLPGSLGYLALKTYAISPQSDTSFQMVVLNYVAPVGQ